MPEFSQHSFGPAYGVVPQGEATDAQRFPLQGHHGDRDSIATCHVAIQVRSQISQDGRRPPHLVPTVSKGANTKCAPPPIHSFFVDAPRLGQGGITRGPEAIVVCGCPYDHPARLSFAQVRELLCPREIFSRNAWTWVRVS